MTVHRDRFDQANAERDYRQAVFERVATVYLDACEAGQPPVRAVAMALGMSPSTAAKWVMRARAAGLLAPTQRGRAPIKYPRCPTCGASVSRQRMNHASEDQL